VADRGRDREAVRNVGNVPVRDTQRRANPDTSGHSQPVDAGRTGGGGSLGHDQPPAVTDTAPIRNQAGTREDTGGIHDLHDPVMPADDATLNTKI
jgi:hypothetical protein